MPVRGSNNTVSVIPTSDKLDTTIDVVCDSCKTCAILNQRPWALSASRIFCRYCSLVTGMGCVGLQKAEGFFSGANFASSTYTKHSNFLFEKMDSFYKDLMKKARERVRTFYITEHLRAPDDQGNMSIDVFFDGTWMNEGHKPHIGFCFIIDVPHRDYHRHGCAVQLMSCLQKGKGTKGHTCHRNFSGKSAAMET